jgi:hypothetical protein
VGLGKAVKVIYMEEPYDSLFTMGKGQKEGQEKNAKDNYGEPGPGYIRYLHITSTVMTLNI